MADTTQDPLRTQRTGKPDFASFKTAAGANQSQDDSKAPLPKGVVLDKDGKPCRTCTDVSSWLAMTKQNKAATSTPSNLATSSSTHATSPASTDQSIASDCPPDVQALGRSTWTLLHSMAATYPETASTQQQADMGGFLRLFSKLYPCWVCADDFQSWMAHPSGQNKPKLGGRKEFGWWMCEAHNEVNRKLGKKEFDCRFWEERWRTGWKDGRCD